MAYVRLYFLLIGLILFLSSNIAAQKSALVITGAVLDVEPTRPIIESPTGNKRDRRESKEPYFAVTIRLTYYNRGDVPLIVPMPETFSFGKKRLVFLEVPSSESRIAATTEEWIIPETMRPPTKDAKSYFVERLKYSYGVPSPPYFVTIQPGTYYECVETIRALSGYKLDLRPNKDKDQPDVEFVIPKHAYFKLQYSLSLKDRPEGRDLIGDAARRWKRYGKLVTNSDNDFLLETEVIINQLPE
jgi:hypothetical protein